MTQIEDWFVQQGYRKAGHNRWKHDEEEIEVADCHEGNFTNRKKKRRLNKKLYRQRYQVEFFFCRLKRWACSSTRRDKLPTHFLFLIQFACVIDWLRYGC